jgi:hypothetical protein
MITLITKYNNSASLTRNQCPKTNKKLYTSVQSIRVQWGTAGRYVTPRWENLISFENKGDKGGIRNAE